MNKATFRLQTAVKFTHVLKCSGIFYMPMEWPIRGSYEPILFIPRELEDEESDKVTLDGGIYVDFGEDSYTNAHAKFRKSLPENESLLVIDPEFVWGEMEGYCECCLFDLLEDLAKMQGNNTGANSLEISAVEEPKNV